MKIYLAILGLLSAFSIAALIQQSGTLEETQNEVQRSQKTIEVLRNRLESLEQNSEQQIETQVFTYTGSANTTEADIPEELVTALANRLTQDPVSMQAIAREVPRSRGDSEATGLAAISAKEFDTQIRDTIEAIEEEERVERMERMQERALERSEDRANRMAEQLGLDSRTSEQFSALMVDHSSERWGIMLEAREMDLGRGETRNLLNQVREEQNQEISGILTTSQYEEYLEIPQDDWGRGGRGGGWGGPPSSNNSGNNNSGNNNSGNNNSGNNNGNNGGGSGGPGRNSGP